MRRLQSWAGHAIRIERALYTIEIGVKCTVAMRYRLDLDASAARFFSLASATALP